MRSWGRRALISVVGMAAACTFAFVDSHRKTKVDYPQLFASPDHCVVETLSIATDVLALYDTGLPTQL